LIKNLFPIALNTSILKKDVTDGIYK